MCSYEDAARRGIHANGGAAVIQKTKDGYGHRAISEADLYRHWGWGTPQLIHGVGAAPSLLLPCPANSNHYLLQSCT